MTVNLIQPNTVCHPDGQQTQVDMKVSKVSTLGRYQLTTGIEIFNLLNGMGNFNPARVPESALREVRNDTVALGPARLHYRHDGGEAGRQRHRVHAHRRQRRAAWQGTLGRGRDDCRRVGQGFTVSNPTQAGYQGVKADGALKSDAATWNIATIEPRKPQTFTLTVSGTGADRPCRARQCTSLNRCPKASRAWSSSPPRRPAAAAGDGARGHNKARDKARSQRRVALQFEPPSALPSTRPVYVVFPALKVISSPFSFPSTGVLPSVPVMFWKLCFSVSVPCGICHAPSTLAGMIQRLAVHQF